MDNASLKQLLQNNLKRDYATTINLNAQNNLLEQIKNLLPTKEASKISDSVLSNYTVTKILDALQIQIDDVAIKIAEAFLQKGVLPEGQDIVEIQKLLKEIPKPENRDAAIQKAVELKLGGADLKDAFVKDVISSKIDQQAIVKILQELKAEVLNNKNLPPDVKVKIDQIIKNISNEFEGVANSNQQLANTTNLKNLSNDEQIIQLLRNQLSSEQLIDNTKGQKVADLLNQIKQLIRLVVDNNISKNDLLKQTDLLMKSVDKASLLADDFVVETNKLLENTKTQWQIFSNSARLALNSIENETNQTQAQRNVGGSADIVKILSQLKVATIKLLEKIDSQFLQNKLVEIPEYIQNKKANESNIKTINDTLPKYQSGEYYKIADARHLIDELKSLLSQSFDAKATYNNLKRSLFAAEISSNGIGALQKILTEIGSAPANVTVKSLLDVLEDMFPDFIRLIKSKNFLADDTPELHQFQNALKESFGADLSKYKKGAMLKSDLQNKLLYTPQLQNEIELIENDFFSKSEVFSSLRKMHENLLRTESRLLSHEFFEKGSGKQDVYQSFDVKINPQFENQNTRLEFYRRKSDEDQNPEKQEELFSFHLDLNLKQTGVIKANLISVANQNQIHLFFAKPEIKNLAIGQQNQLVEQLASIPFNSQLFFHDLINEPPETKRPQTNSGFDQLA